MIKKAIFPAAGFGTRFLPVTKALPKEMLPVVDKPVIQYLVEEAVASGIEEIIIVTGRGKRAIEDHFDHSYELEKNLVERGKRNLLAEVRRIQSLAKFIYVRQPLPLGDGHAILCAKEVIGDEPCAVLFGDDLVDSRVPALKQLIDVYEQTKTPVIAVEKIEKEESEKYGIIACRGDHEEHGAGHAPKKNNFAGMMKRAFGKQDDRVCHGNIHEVIDLFEKPKPAEAPSRYGVIGKYVITPQVMEALEKASVNKGHGHEVRLIDALKIIAQQRRLVGVELEGKRYDTGDKLGLLKATIDFALKRKDMAPGLKRHIQGLDL